MAKYTTQEYQTLVAAKATGALEVEYGDKKVKYRSIEHINAIIADMEIDLGLAKPKNGRVYASFSKGL